MALDRRDPMADFAALADEEERRAKEALKVYRPARQLPFHHSNARELVLRGGKRSGKSVGVVAEFASRVLGIPITDPANKEIPLKYVVSTPKDPLLYWVVGWDVDHIGQTVYRLLFQPGLFRVIKDKMTGIWRTYNPADDFDASRFSESQPAGPMIPERFIDTTQGVDGWTWENRGAYNFSAVYLKNGAKICAYPSSAKHPKQGDAVAGIWIDEDIQIPGHLKEWQDRLTDKDGWLMWSVWPHSKNYALCDMLDRAEEQSGEESPDIASYQLIMSENPYLHKAAKTRALGRMGSDEEIARRDRGELLLDTLNMYDYYPATHLLTPYPPGEVPETVTTAKEYLRRILTRDGEFPKTWTRYLSIDPSHTRTACTFGVIPPPEVEEIRFDNLLIIERELIVQKYSSDMLANELRKICEGFNYEAFIMDQQIGRQTRVGEDKTIFQKYAESFTAHGLRARMCPNAFIPGCNVPPERYRAVRNMLEMRRTGLPTLLFVENRTVGTQREFNTYRKKQLFVGGEDTIMDEPANPRKHDAMASLEYMCAFIDTMFATGSAYVHPDAYRSHGGSPAYRRAMQLLKKHAEQASGEYVHLGPGAAA